VGHDVIEVGTPTHELRTHLQSQRVEHEDLGHRLIIYGQESDGMFHQISSRYCQEGCVLRMATLEDVFLKLTGRGLRE
jgi:lipooligosaccharide transport system ATP-binding protein